ncbi:MAG: PAS domain S-box protein [Deltaproteobacteria bacterium]|nr:PAS domain S-box protein [Deltaproteobacteria bacterium]
MNLPDSEKLLNMFDRIPGSVAFVNADTLQYEFVNNSFATSFALRREEIIGRHIKEIIGEANCEFAMTYIEKVRNGETCSYENRFQLASGIRWIEVNYSPMAGTEGRVTTFAVLSNDITSRKKAEEALLASENRFRQLADSTFEAIVVHDKGAILDVNAAFCRMFGYERDEVIGKSAMAFIAPEFQSLVLENIKKGFNRPYENGIVCKDGTIVVIETIGRQIQHGDRVVRVTAMRDISERKKSEQALRESQQRLALAAQSAQLGIWDWDIVNNHLHWDDQMFRLYGIEKMPEKFGVEMWKNALHPDDVDTVWNTCEAAIRGEKKYDIEFRIQHPNGNVRVIKADGVVIRNDNGEVVHMIGINRDITDEKRAEAEHLKFEKQLQQMQKLESIGILAGGIAHDFNNLMGGIYGFIDLAASETAEGNVANYLSHAMATIDRARALTRQLLTFARGGDPIQKSGNLFPFVEETARFALSGANVSCRFDVADNLWPCSFDKNQIGQVIDNLIINAQQAMPLGGTIDLVARNILISENENSLLKPGRYVTLKIKDSGIGIPSDLLSKIFDPFFTTKAKGHGLGLATCYSIVTRHGGWIDVTSTPGAGSVFQIYLPAADELVKDSPVPPLSPHQGQGTFVIMDDEQVVLDTVSAMLGSVGYNVVCTQNGDEAISVCKSEISGGRDVAAMLFDLTIPGGMGGTEAVAEIKRLDAKIPVFVASGYAEDPVMKEPEKFGFAASICKPFRKSELLAMLTAFMGK